MSVTSTALSFVGKVKYVFGAADPVGGKSDCSGFTQYCFKQNGVNIGRSSGEQARQGTPVSRNNLQPGDLVIFQNTYKAGISHVGISLGGDKFVHCCNRGVVTSSLNESYYSTRFHSGRRISGVDGGTGIAGSVTDTSTGEVVQTGWLGLPSMAQVVTVILITACFMLSVFFVFMAFKQYLPSMDDVAKKILKEKVGE